jgi:hypothetical protein
MLEIIAQQPQQLFSSPFLSPVLFIESLPNRRLARAVRAAAPRWLALLRIEADEKGAEAVYVLEAVWHARRNVKNITGFQRLLDSTLYQTARDIVCVGPLFHIEKLAAGYCDRAPGADQPDIE